MDRRRFLASGLPIAALAAGSNKPLWGIDPFDRPKPGNLRLSLAAYSLRQYLAPKTRSPQSMDLFGFIDFCHSQGIPGVELTSYYFPESVTQEYLLAIKRHCHLRGMTISGGAIRNDFCQQNESGLKADLEHTRLWIDRYALLGAPVIRIFAGTQPEGEPLSTTLARCVQYCDLACQYAEQKGVLLALENHGGVTAKADGLLEIVRKIKSTAFGVNFDSGNFQSSDNPYAELEKIAPYAVNAQIKVEMRVAGKDQPTDLQRVLRLLKDAGYSGWVALEYESKEEPLQAIPKHLDELKRLLATVS